MTPPDESQIAGPHLALTRTRQAAPAGATG